MAKFLVVMNDHADADNCGRPAQILQKMSHNILVVMMEGCPASKRMEKEFPELPTRIVNSVDDIEDLHFDIVFSSMVRTDFLWDLALHCKETDIPVVFIQDRPGWGENWMENPPNVLITDTGSTAWKEQVKWEAAARKMGMSITVEFAQAPILDLLCLEADKIVPEALRTHLGVPLSRPFIYLACDKVGGPEMAKSSLQVLQAMATADGVELFVLVNMHPSASDEDKAKFAEVLSESRGNVKFVKGDHLSPVERMMACDILIGVIGSGMPEQASRLGRVPIAMAGPTELAQLEAYAGLTRAEEHPFADCFVIAKDPSELEVDLRKALDGALELHHVLPARGEGAQDVADIVSNQLS